MAAIALLSFTAVPAAAHGLATSDSKSVGNYVVEFEYNSTGNVVAGEYTLFLVYLLDAETKNGVNYDSAAVRIEKDNGPAALSASLKGSSDGMGFSSISGAIPEPGSYQASVSFYRDGKVIASSDFDFHVDAGKPAASRPWVWPVAGAVLLVAGLALGRFLKPRKIE